MKCNKICDGILSSDDPEYDGTDFYENTCEHCWGRDYKDCCKYCRSRLKALPCFVCGLLTAKICCKFHNRPCCKESYSKIKQECEERIRQDKLIRCTCGITLLLKLKRTSIEAWNETKKEDQDICPVHKQKHFESIGGILNPYREDK